MLTQQIRLSVRKTFCSLQCFCNIPMINEHEFEGFSQPQRNIKVCGLMKFLQWFALDGSSLYEVYLIYGLH